MSDLSVSTNLSDYAPGSTAYITTSGLDNGESVQFLVEVISAPGADGLYGTADDVVDTALTSLLDGQLQPWTVQEDGAGDTNAIDGVLQTSWYVDPDALNTTLRLTARTAGADGIWGNGDDEVAMTSFTDALGSASKSYAHWSDEPLPGDWNNNILNDNKSNYFEGEVIPHVFIYEGKNAAQLVNGQSYSFNVTYNYYQENTDAGGFAYMTQYDLSRQPNVFNWATPAITPGADGAFTNGGGMFAGASFYTVDANITNVSAVTYTGTGTLDGHVTITFTYTGATGGNGTYAAIYYGLYIAKPGQVPDQDAGKTNGANAWTGGSLQTTVDIGGSGAESIQLSPDAIIPGEISGLKFNDLDRSGTKGTGEPGLADWTIVLDNDSDPNNGNIGTVLTADGTTDDLDGNGVIDPLGFYYFSVTPGTYYVYEVNQEGWTQTAPSTVYYGPLIISAATPEYTGRDFGNWFNPDQTVLIAIEIDKKTQDTTAPAGVPGDGLNIMEGHGVKWIYTVTNEGDRPLSNVTVTDDQGVVPVLDAALSSGEEDGILDLDDVWVYTAIDTAVAGSYSNTGTAYGEYTTVLGELLSDDDTDPSSYFGANPVIDIDKKTQDTFAPAGTPGDGLNIMEGHGVKWIYTVTNPGNVALSGVTVTDSQGGVTPAYVSGDDGDGLLENGESWIYEASGSAVAGNYSNTGTASGSYSDSAGHSETATDSDASSYFGAAPAIDIEKYVSVDNGATWVDADSPQGPGLLAPSNGGYNPKFKFEVTNTGNVALSNVSVTDTDFDLNGGAAGTAWTIGSLGAGGSTSLIITAPWQEGQHTDTGTASGSYSDDAGHAMPVSDSDNANFFGKAPSFDLEKSVTGVYNADDSLDDDGIVDTAGDYIVYGISLENTGNVPLSGVQVIDPYVTNLTRVGDTPGDNDNSLEVGEVWNYTAKHVVTQEEMDLGASVVAVNAVLPTDGIMKMLGNPGVGNMSYWTVQIGDGIANANDTVFDNIYNAWCADNDRDIQTGQFFGSMLYSTYEIGTIPAGIVDDTGDLDLVNWIINQDYVGQNAGGGLGNYTYGDVQQAIWQLIEDTPSTAGLGSWNQTRVNQIKTAAGAHDGFVPGVGQDVAILVVPSGAQGYEQSVLIEFKLHDELCNVVWADTAETPPQTDEVCTPVDRDPAIAINKVTVDAPASGDGLTILTGEPIQWKYIVTNAGNVTLTNVVVADSEAGVTPVLDAAASTGEEDGELNIGDIWVYTAPGTSITGPYNNVGTASGDFSGSTVTDTDPSSYFGADPQIAIDKKTQDTFAPAGTAADGNNILEGHGVKWIYTVTNAGNVALSSVTLTDDQSGVTPSYISGDIDLDGKLDLTETWIYEATGTAQAGDYSNTGTATGSFTDTAGHTRTDTASDDSSYFGADPDIDIEKYVSVDGGVTWVDADTPTGPTLVGTGTNPQFKFVVTNTGNVDLSNVSVTDTDFDLNGAALGTAWDVGSLAAGASDELIFTGATWQLGQHSNTATVTADPYVDTAGHQEGVTDSDAAHYFGALPGLVTNSSLCTFGDTFNLIFTPDFQLANGNYKLSDSNPGQFYYNLFYQDAPNTDADFVIDIPFPFVTQGAVPIHVYDDVSIEMHDGQMCLTPVGEIANYKLTDSDVSWTLLDTNGNGKGDVGEFYRLTINDVSTGDDGFIYLNVHLDYGLEKQTGWSKQTSVSGTDNAVDNATVPGIQPEILDNHAYTFSAAVDDGVNVVDLPGSEDTIYNDNLFKSAKGFMGFAKDLNGAGAEDDLFAGGMKVKIVNKATNATAWSGATDAEGWYYGNFFATGKATTYKITADTNKNGVFDNGDTTFEATLGGATKYAQVDFFGDWPGQGS